MASVDDRIVAMGFQSNNFEKKVADTISAIDKLKASLDFSNSKRGLDDLQNATKGFNLAGIGSALDNISGKFSAMGAVAFSVINNVVNRAVDAGIQIAKSLSLDLIISGFQEYETNMNAIQTVLANTRADGTNLQDVNKALDTLNQYSDQTIYNFGEMARNIGTFTAAGVDLDTSVSAIKGIANLAAISGSNSQQASTAMYQLSQALATGSVKLMDWNSIVNAGMGGEVFQKALFETGKALGTIKDTPIDTTFEEWTAAGNTFRGTLEDGWLTGEVLTNTLQGFTGDLTDAQLLALGYTQDQIKEIQELGKTGKAAATEVKTLTQLISTVKESIGSGWSASFRIIFGDFEEAKELFTGINDAIGNFVGKSADARNELLNGWKWLGGRTVLIEALKNVFEALGRVFQTVKNAFRDVFPPLTFQRLYDLTVQFRDFTDKLILGKGALDKIGRVFVGVFNAIKIAWEIVKGIRGAMVEFFTDVLGFDGGGSGILEFFATLGDKISKLKEVLVDGGGIKKFFEDLPEAISAFMSALTFDNVLDKIIGLAQKVKDAIFGLFTGEDSVVPDGVTDAFGRVGDRFGWLVTLAHSLGDAWDWLKTKFDAIREALGTFGQFIQDNFGDIPQKIADVLSTSDYDAALDVINTGLFGGLVLLFKKFIDTGFGDFGGIFRNVNQGLEALTGTLEAMQLKLKAEALLDIAKALALLTVSLVVLSLIDSGALTKSLGAIAIGFAQLITAMALLGQITSGPTSAASMAILAGGLILLAGAILILSFAAKNLSGMDWEELAKGLAGVTALLGIMSAAVIPLSKNSDGMIRAGIGMIGISIALNIMALALKSFAQMSWEEMAQGMVGVAGGLGAIVVTMQLMPDNARMISTGLGIIALAVALNIMALAVKSFAEMDWSSMGKGLAGVGASLLVIAGAMHLMPGGLILQGAGLLMISIGLAAIAKAMKSMASMSWAEMGKGLAGIAGSLLILAGAAAIMSGALPGAIAIGIMALSLNRLAEAVKKFGNMSWKELLIGLGAMGVALVALAAGAALMAPVTPALLALGAALLLIGAGFALFGLGASLFASAFALIATSGTQGIAVLVAALQAIIAELPAFIAAFGEGFKLLADKILEALPNWIASFSEILTALFDLIIDNVPKFVEAGFAILLGFLRGIRDNIGEIATTVADIITNFLDALSLKIPEIIDSVTNFVLAVLKGVVSKLGEVASFLLPKGVEFLSGLLSGIIEKASDLGNWFLELPGKILEWIGDVASWLKNKGIDFIGGLIRGVLQKALEIASWFLDLPSQVLKWIGNVLSTLKNKGLDLIGGLIRGITEKAIDITNWFMELPGKVLKWIGDTLQWLYDAGWNIIEGLWDGLQDAGKWLKEKIAEMVDWIIGPFEEILGLFSPSRVFMEYGENIGEGLIIGLDSMQQDIRNTSEMLGNQVVDGFDPDAAEMGKKATKAISEFMTRIPSIMDGMVDFNPVITPVLDLSNVEKNARDLGRIFGGAPTMSIDLSRAHADAILADSVDVSDDPEVQVQGPTEIKFEQNNYSPEALSVSDIYRQTRNQIALAKEELAVL